MRTTHELGASTLEETPQLRSYQPMNPDRREIRLIRFSRSNVQLENHCLDDRPVYHAISYHWGSPLPTSEVCVEGEVVKLRKTVAELFDCLRQRYGPRRCSGLICCINQHNLDERNSQVTMMADIFASAVDVISWLGEADDLSKVLFQHLKRNTQCHTASSTQITESQAKQPSAESTCVPTLIGPEAAAKGMCHDDPHAETIIVQAFRSIALKPYWSRVWVAQEVIPARGNWVLCGDDCAKLSRFARHRTTYCEHQEVINRWKIIQDLQQFRYDFRNEGIGFRWLLETFTRGDCSNSLDKVYDLRALNKILSAIEVDYSKKPIEVFLSVLQAGLLHLDHGHGLQTIPAPAFDMGLSEESFPSDVNKACNATIPIPVDGELIGHVLHAVGSNFYGDPVQPEEPLLIGVCLKTTWLNGEERDHSGTHSTSSYVLADTYKPPNKPLWSQCVQAGDLLVHVRSYSPISLLLRPQKSKEPSCAPVSGQIYSVVANFRPSLVLPTVTFEADPQTHLDRYAMNGTVFRAEITLSSPKSATAGLQLAEALSKHDGDSSPDEDEASRYWKCQNSKTPELHRFLLDCPSLPNLFLWNTTGKINYVLSGT